MYVYLYIHTVLIYILHIILNANQLNVNMRIRQEQHGSVELFFSQSILFHVSMFFFPGCHSCSNKSFSSSNHWVVVSNICYFHFYLGKWSNLTHIFRLGWNHQLNHHRLFGAFCLCSDSRGWVQPFDRRTLPRSWIATRCWTWRQWGLVVTGLLTAKNDQDFYHTYVYIHSYMGLLLWNNVKKWDICNMNVFAITQCKKWWYWPYQWVGYCRTMWTREIWYLYIYICFLLLYIYI